MGRKRAQGVVGHMQADGSGGSDEKAVMTGDMGSSLITCGGVLNLCMAHLKMQMPYFYLVCHFSSDVSYSSSVCVCLLLYILIFR